MPGRKSWVESRRFGAKSFKIEFFYDPRWGGGVSIARYCISYIQPRAKKMCHLKMFSSLAAAESVHARFLIHKGTPLSSSFATQRGSG